MSLYRPTRSAAVERAAAIADRARAPIPQSEGEDVGIAAITASELLHGVQRATEEHRGRRETFVESILAAFPVIAFDLLVARVHARLWAGLVSSGGEVGAHDRLVAASALSAGWRIATANIAHFNRIPGLDVVPVQLG